MEYFRKYLIFLRRTENENDFKMRLSTMLLIASSAGILIGFLMDLLLPQGYFSNMFRGVVAVASGATLFSYSYLALINRSHKKTLLDDYYKPVRERFSFRQRINFSIAAGVLIASFVLLSNNSGLTFTLKAILAVLAILSLVAFSRRSRSEFIKDIYNIPDIRDLATKRERVNMTQDIDDEPVEKEKEK